MARGCCKETSQEKRTEHATDKTLIPHMSKLLSDKMLLVLEMVLGFIREKSRS
jgi:hypothetical protein